jgi:YD repeat-containing protein
VVDAAGRVARVEAADGCVLRIRLGADGRLARVDANDGSFIAIEAAGDRGFRVGNPAGVTDVEASRDGYALRRSSGTLRFEHHAAGRLRRVLLPGSAEPLVYDWRADGSCRIGGAVEVLPTTSGTRFVIGQAMLEETREPLGVRLASGGDAVEIGWDSLGRTVFRRWSDVFAESFTRDPNGRMSAWTRGGARRAYVYAGAELCAEEEAGARWTRELDAEGRVAALIRPDGTRISYAYDAAGRRVRRDATRYDYDAFGQLIAVATDSGPRICFAYDGLGHRVMVETRGGVRFEHRDASGRLWAVTDASGRALHVFLWWQDRMLARLDGPVGSAVAETFVTDHAGTLIGILRSDGIERIEQPPFGAVHAVPRPALYGHVGDPESGLIAFGARVLDPELGLFLTPDPWHGGADDPRLWAGASPRDLRLAAEISLAGVHPYALCQFDPAGLLDADGHQSKTRGTGTAVLDFILSVILTPTWGWPLTAVSLFFFFPLNIYFEVISFLLRAVKIFPPTQTALSIFRSIPPFLMASSRQEIVAATMNGFLPRIVTGLSSERAMTIGNCVWIDRLDIRRLERPKALMVDNLAGFNTESVDLALAMGASPAQKLSAMLVEAKRDGKKWFHASYWSRGFGNAVQEVAGALSFKDIAVDGVSRAAIHLASPFPLDFPAGAENSPALQEYVYDPAPHGSLQSQAKVLKDTWFGLRTPADIHLNKGDPIEIKAPDLPPGEPAVHLAIADIQTGKDFSIVTLSGALPVPYQAAGLKMNVSRVRAKAGATETAWAAGAADTELTATAPGDDILGLGLRTDSLLEIAGAGPAPAPLPPGGGAPAGLFTRIKEIGVTLQLSSPLDAEAAVNAMVRLLEDDADTFDAVVQDPPMPNKFTWKGGHGGIHDGDLVSISTGAPDKTTYGVVKPGAADTLEVDLAAPAFNAVAGTVVHVHKVHDKEKDDDAGTVTAVAKDNVPIKVGRLGIFAKDLRVHCKAGGKDQVRTITGVGEVKLTVTDHVPAPVPAPAPGATPFKLTLAEVDDDSTVKGAVVSKLLRFLEFIPAAGMTLPSGFGHYPDFLLNVGIQNMDRKIYRLSVFFGQIGGGDFDDAFHGRWKPIESDGKHYFLLERDLPYEETGSGAHTHVFWRFDTDTPEEARARVSGIAGVDPYVVTLYEFKKTGASHAVTLVEPQVQVPDYPSTVDTHAEALRQHELHHAYQNTRWGPFLGALPIAGVERLIELGNTTAKDKAAWLAQTDEEKRKAVDQFKGVQWASIGSILQLTWMYAVAFGQANTLKFEDWNRILNPLAGNLIAKFPDIDPNAPLSDRPGIAIMQILNTLTDLRSWFPFVGFVPGILPDGPLNFIEQHASQSSGDLYSTILSADDKYNRESNTRVFLPDFIWDSHAANITTPLGRVLRLMLFASERDDTMLTQGFCNATGSPVTYMNWFAPLLFDFPGTHDPVTIAPDVDVLVHPALFEPTGVAGATVRLAGPASNPGPVDFVTIAKGDAFRPRLRALVPTPLRVSRSTGWYFIAATPAKYACKGYYYSAGNAEQDAKTQNVELTVQAGDITFAGEAIGYAMPAAPAPASTFDRFVGETPEVVIKDQPFKDPDWWQISITDTTAAGAALPVPALVTAAKQAQGWKLTIAKTLPAPAAATPVRVRIYRIFKKNDVTDDTKNDPAFDLTFDPHEHPTLKNVRSYLDDDLWIPVRDFVFTVQPLPTLSGDGNPVKVDTEEPYLLDLALPLKGDVKPVTTLVPPGVAGAPARLEVELTGNKGRHPRGQQWRIKPIGPVIEDTAKYKISVTYEGGAAPDPLDFTIEPHIRIDKAAGQADFTASEANPCKLSIVGHDGPFTVAKERLPATVSAEISPAGSSTIVVSVGASPPADVTGAIVVTDSKGKKGRRTVTIKKT